MLKENSSLPRKVVEKLSEDSIILAFDYGLARIGVAIGNTVVTVSYTHLTLPTTTWV